jgi:hypothetical protein
MHAEGGIWTRNLGKRFEAGIGYENRAKRKYAYILYQNAAIYVKADYKQSKHCAWNGRGRRGNNTDSLYNYCFMCLGIRTEQISFSESHFLLLTHSSFVWMVQARLMPLLHADFHLICLHHSKAVWGEVEGVT